MKPAEAEFYFFASLEEASRALCREIIREARQAMSAYGDFRLVLAGGSTPVPLYEMLAAESDNPGIPWKSIHLFWGDERFLPQDHPESNYYLAAETFLNKVPLAAENIHPVPVWLATAHEAASQYDQILGQFENRKRPLFDLTVLGLGEDGHTASLFPGYPVLEDKLSLAAALEEPAGSPPVPRITMTLKGLARSSRICFLIAGKKKREIMEKIRTGGREDIYPAARVRAMDWLEWFAA